MSGDTHSSPRRPRRRDSSARARYQEAESLLRGGGIGIALVTAATLALVAVAAVIAVVVTALY